MKSVAIARNTFREAVRDKIFALVGVFGLLLVLSSIVLSPLTVGAQTKIVADVGLASITLFALLIVLLVGSGMVYKEIDKRTIMTLLSKPVTRLDYIVGKFLGLMATLAVIMSAMTLLFFLVVWITPTEFQTSYLTVLFLALCEMTVITAVAMFFSSFTTPVLTSLFTLGIFMVGHTINDLSRFAEVIGGPGLQALMNAMKIVLPNLALFNVRSAAVHGVAIPTGQVLWAVAYCILYSGVMLIFAGWFFRRREFK